EHAVPFAVPLTDPLPPQYFVRVVSDRWLHAEHTIPVSFRHLLLPDKFPPPTELLDLRPLPVSALRNARYESLYAEMGLTAFNAIQTQTFKELYETDDSVLVCAPTGSGKTVCAEFALLRLFRTEPRAKAVYVALKPEICEQRFRDWSTRLGENGLGKRVARLTGETTADTKILGDADLTVATAAQWDSLSRRWKQRRPVQEVGLLVADELHLLGGEGGPTLEIVVSRARYISSQTERRCRIIGLSSSLADAKDVGDWVGATSHSLFNFLPDVRPVPLEMHLHGFDIGHFGSRMLAMARQVYNAVSASCGGSDKPAIVFVPSRRQCQLTAIDLVTHAAAEDRPDEFLHDSDGAAAAAAEASREPALRQTLAHGVGFVHAGMSEAEREMVMGLYRAGAIQVLVAPHAMTWSVAAPAHLVVIMGTERYDGAEHRYVDYPVADMLQMIGLASRPLKDIDGKVVILCHSPKKEFLKKVLYEPLPIESHLDHALTEHLNAEIVTRTIENLQDGVDYLTWTFYYRRLPHNPNYYNMLGAEHTHVSDNMSELVERCINELKEARCIAVEEEGAGNKGALLSALNLGMIASYYYIHYTTVELFANSVGERTKLRGLLDILSNASEYNTLPIRQHEERALDALLKHLPQKLPDDWKLTDTPAKAHVLLQAHFNRVSVGVDLRVDQRRVLEDAPRLLQAIVDVISSNGWLKPALEAMELSQMVVQGVWRGSYLQQVPHVTAEAVAACEAEGVDGPAALLEIDAEKRDELLQLPAEKMAEVAVFCNNFPDIDVSYTIEASLFVAGGVNADEVLTGEPVSLTVVLTREGVDDDPEPPGGFGSTVLAPRFPAPKAEGWWLVIGDRKKNALLAIKRVPQVNRKQKVKLDFAAPDAPGRHELALLFMCDSYQGCDQEIEVEVDVGVPGGSDDDD
ncbi:unnamed protein product, partial [Phaeothamnion confervicola]